MYKGYDLHIDENEFDNYLGVGRAIHADTKKSVKETLDTFKDRNGKLIASKISANWFPPIYADIFISHSHADAQTAMGLSGWLKKEFGLTAFIDSCVWGYAGDLQKMIDNEYSRSSNTSNYDYAKTVRSAAHVNMMLSVALARMMDKCECILFINTPQSISSEGYIRGTATESPWIFSEIAMTSLIQRRKPSEHRATASVEVFKEDVRMVHEVSLDHLISIDRADLRRWSNLCNVGGLVLNQKITGAKALDKLYGMKS